MAARAHRGASGASAARLAREPVVHGRDRGEAVARRGTLRPDLHAVAAQRLRGAKSILVRAVVAHEDGPAPGERRVAPQRTDRRALVRAARPRLDHAHARAGSRNPAASTSRCMAAMALLRSLGRPAIMQGDGGALVFYEQTRIRRESFPQRLARCALAPTGFPREMRLARPRGATRGRAGRRPRTRCAHQRIERGERRVPVTIATAPPRRSRTRASSAGKRILDGDAVRVRRKRRQRPVEIEIQRGVGLQQRRPGFRAGFRHASI